MSRRKITLVGQTYYPDATSTSQLLTVMLESLAAREPDLQIQVLCGFPSGAPPAETRRPRCETIHGVSIRRCGLAIDHKRHLVNRALAYASYLAGVFWRLISQRHDLVFGITNPPFNAILIWLASHVRYLPYQYMIQDAYPEGLVVLGKLSEASWMTRIWKWFNGKAYRRAHRMFVLGRDMIPLLESNYGVPRDRIVYVPHWSVVPNHEAKSLEESSLRKELGLEGKFIIQYSGNMGLWHDMNMFVRAAEALRDHSEIHFLFIGGGRRRKEAESLSRQLRLPNVTWRDFVPIDQLDDSLACCHVSLISLMDGLEGVAVPCKLYGILASGRAVLAQVPSMCEVAMAVQESQCGIVVRPGDLAGLVSAICLLANDPGLTENMGHAARQAFLENYTVDIAANRLLDQWLTCRADAGVVTS